MGWKISIGGQKADHLLQKPEACPVLPWPRAVLLLFPCLDADTDEEEISWETIIIQLEEIRLEDGLKMSPLEERSSAVRVDLTAL